MSGARVAPRTTTRSVGLMMALSPRRPERPDPGERRRRWRAEQLKNKQPEPVERPELDEDLRFEPVAPAADIEGRFEYPLPELFADVENELVERYKVLAAEEGRILEVPINTTEATSERFRTFVAHFRDARRRAVELRDRRVVSRQLQVLPVKPEDPVIYNYARHFPWVEDLANGVYDVVNAELDRVLEYEELEYEPLAGDPLWGHPVAWDRTFILPRKDGDDPWPLPRESKHNWALMGPEEGEAVPIDEADPADRVRRLRNRVRMIGDMRAERAAAEARGEPWPPLSEADDDDDDDGTAVISERRAKTEPGDPEAIAADVAAEQSTAPPPSSTGVRGWARSLSASGASLPSAGSRTESSGDRGDPKAGSSSGAANKPAGTPPSSPSSPTRGGASAAASSATPRLHPEAPGGSMDTLSPEAPLPAYAEAVRAQALAIIEARKLRMHGLPQDPKFPGPKKDKVAEDPSLPSLGHVWSQIPLRRWLPLGIATNRFRHTNLALDGFAYPNLTPMPRNCIIGRLPPGVKTPIRSDLDNSLLTLLIPFRGDFDGRCGVEVNGKKYPWANGEPIVFDSTNPYRYYNNGEEAAWILHVDMWRPEFDNDQDTRAGLAVFWNMFSLDKYHPSLRWKYEARQQFLDEAAERERAEERRKERGDSYGRRKGGRGGGGSYGSGGGGGSVARK